MSGGGRKKKKKKKFIFYLLLHLVSYITWHDVVVVCGGMCDVTDGVVYLYLIGTWQMEIGMVYCMP